VRLDQAVDISRLLDGESAWAITTLKILESVDRNTRCASCELKQSTLLFVRPRSDGLPKVDNNFVALLVALSRKPFQELPPQIESGTGGSFLTHSVVRVFGPIVHIDLGHAANQELHKRQVL
jgi:hypothetical protein